MKKILIVDDDPVVRNLVSNLVSREGHQVETAVDGLEGIRLFDVVEPDLIITDVIMPNMDGYEFCKKIRALPQGRHIPFIMLTSLDSIEHKLKGFEYGANDYVTKPLEPREFIARVNSFLTRSEVIQQATVSKKTTAQSIGVFSLRGGAGVSTVSTNVSIGLSNIWGKTTTLVDFVMAGGQSAMFFNTNYTNSWADISKYPFEEIDDNLVNTSLVSHKSGVQILPSPKQVEHSELVTLDKVNLILPILKRNSDYLIFDLPHDFRSITLSALENSDLKLIIVQPEVTSIRAAAMTLRIFKDVGFDMEKVYMILNWTFPNKGINIREIEEVLQKKFTMVIPYASDEFIEALNLGVPPTYSNPEEPLGMLFEDLSLVLSKDEHRSIKPENPTESWQRVMARYKERKNTG